MMLCIFLYLEIRFMIYHIEANLQRKPRLEIGCYHANEQKYNENNFH